MLRVCNFGGGKNSTALLIEAVRRGERPDIILFADTGGEKPEIYAHVAAFSRWLVERGFPEITVVRCEREDGVATLEEECLLNSTLPSKVFGFSGCSVKWKVQPQDKYLSQHPDVLAAWERGEKVERWLGFHADERHRMDRRLEKDAADVKWSYRYLLIEWDMGQAECEAVLVGMQMVVGKSSCFYCPSMKKHEIRALQRQHPSLLERALVMERRARPGLREKEGLGSHFAWEDYLRQPELPFGTACDVSGGPDLCDSCYDGE